MVQSPIRDDAARSTVCTALTSFVVVALLVFSLVAGTGPATAPLDGPLAPLQAPAPSVTTLAAP